MFCLWTLCKRKERVPADAKGEAKIPTNKPYVVAKARPALEKKTVAVNARKATYEKKSAKALKSSRKVKRFDKVSNRKTDSNQIQMY